MKRSSVFILPIVILQIFSCHGSGDCDGVTVGDCPVYDNVIQIVNIFTDVRDCQFYCNALTNCELFRFDGKDCILFTKDYRKECKTASGPHDKPIDECLKIDNMERCDLFIQEDCEFTGDVLLEPPVGTIADPKQCEELCVQFNSLGCKYWIFNDDKEECSLRSADTKSCQTWGGPRSPSFDECVGVTTLKPITEVPKPTTEVPEPTTEH